MHETRRPATKTQPQIHYHDAILSHWSNRLVFIPTATRCQLRVLLRQNWRPYPLERVLTNHNENVLTLAINPKQWYS